MNARQLETLQNVESMLSNLYWELKENHEERAARRVDTIRGKIHELMHLDESNKGGTR